MASKPLRATRRFTHRTRFLTEPQRQQLRELMAAHKLTPAQLEQAVREGRITLPDREAQRILFGGPADGAMRSGRALWLLGEEPCEYDAQRAERRRARGWDEAQVRKYL